MQCVWTFFSIILYDTYMNQRYSYILATMLWFFFPYWWFLVQINSFFYFVKDYDPFADRRIPTLADREEEKDYDPFAERRRPTIADREDEYRQKRRRMIISPERVDPFAEGQYILIKNSHKKFKAILIYNFLSKYKQ